MQLPAFGGASGPGTGTADGWLPRLALQGYALLKPNRPATESARAEVAFVRSPSARHVETSLDGICAAMGGRPYLLATEDSGHEARVDLATVLQLWQRQGASMLSQLGGAFWLAIFDPVRGETLLAVDRHAKENLFYVANGNELAFATRLSLLADHPLVARRVSPQAIFDYLYFHCVPGPETIHAGARRLLPGHYLHQCDGHTRVEAWWRPDFPAPALPSNAARIAALPELLENAVARALEPGPVGCFLSGGLDSSTVTGLAARRRPGEVTAFTIGFDAQGYDEMEYASEVARHFAVPHMRYYVTPRDIVDSLPQIVDGLDGPFGNASAIPTYFCARMAAEHGCQQLLAGDGGDELFGGNTRYMTQLKFELYGRLPRSLRNGLLEPALQALPTWTKRGLVRKAASYVAQAATPLPGRLMTYNLLERLPVGDILAPDFLLSLDRSRPLTRLEEMYPAGSQVGTVNRLLQLDWRLTLADSDLPKVNRMCELAGVGVAFPMLNEGVVDYAASLAASDKVTLRQMRPLYRRAFANFLPAQTLRKGKQGFGLPFGPWLATDPMLQEFAHQQLSYLEQNGILKPGFRDAFLGAGLAAHPGYYGVLVYILVALGLWMQRARANLIFTST